MDNTEALNLLRQHLETYRRQTHQQLATLTAGSPYYSEIIGPGGIKYTLEVEVEKWGQDIVVDGWIDDGNWRAMAPLGTGFTMAPTDTCVDHPAADV